MYVLILDIQWFLMYGARRCFSTPAMLYMWMARCCGQKVGVRTFQVAKVSNFGWVSQGIASFVSCPVNFRVQKWMNHAVWIVAVACFQWKSRWWQLKYFLCSPLLGEMIQFDSYFSDGLVQPPTRNSLGISPGCFWSFFFSRMGFRCSSRSPPSSENFHKKTSPEGWWLVGSWCFFLLRKWSLTSGVVVVNFFAGKNIFEILIKWKVARKSWGPVFFFQWEQKCKYRIYFGIGWTFLGYWRTLNPRKVIFGSDAFRHYLVGVGVSPPNSYSS